MINDPVKTIRAVVLMSFAAMLCAADAPAADRAPDRPRLETARARELHNLAVEIAASSQIAATKAEMKVLMQRDPQAKTPDGQARLTSALDEITMSFILQSMTFDTQHPQLIWWNNPPYAVNGETIPGSRFALDNPDNINQIASLDPTETYEIRGQRSGTGPTQVSFVVYQAYLINDGPPSGATEEARLVDPKVSPDGNYTITIGPGPANGRKNYIQNSSTGRFLLVRQTLSDWSQQDPDILEIRRSSPSAAAYPTRQDYTQEAVRLIKKGFPYWLNFQNRSVFSQPANALPRSILVPGWRFIAMGHFHLKPDEALIVSVNSLDARYVALEAADPWMRSLEAIHQSGSLNSMQAQPNEDGTYTFVVSAVDPGVHNWIDADGLMTGSLFLRWQGFPGQPPENAEPIRSVMVAKLNQLKARLPAGTVMVSTLERQKQLSRRAATWQRRVLP